MTRITEEAFLERRKRIEEEEAAIARQRKEAADKGIMKQRWMKAEGGSPEDFEAVWPKLRDEARTQRLIQQEERLRATRYRSGI